MFRTQPPKDLHSYTFTIRNFHSLLNVLLQKENIFFLRASNVDLKQIHDERDNP